MSTCRVSALCLRQATCIQPLARAKTAETKPAATRPEYWPGSLSSTASFSKENGESNCSMVASGAPNKAAAP